jgi:hypothetical protein
MTVTVPRLHPELWQGMALEAAPDSPVTVIQTGPLEFTAYYLDEVEPMKVRYAQGDIGEEHEASASKTGLCRRSIEAQVSSWFIAFV